MYVVKRDGRLEAFDGSRIERAVLGAMREVGHVDGEAASSVKQEVWEIVSGKGVDRVHVEEIQDLVELSLMRLGLYEVAKAYILHRKRREAERLEKKRLLEGREPGRWTKKALSLNAVRLLAARYLLRGPDGRLMEDPEGMVLRVASAVAAAEAGLGPFDRPIPEDFIRNNYIDQSIRRVSGNRESYFKLPAKAVEAFQLYKMLLYEKRFLPNSPTLFNAGTKLGQLSACFVLPMDDSLSETEDSIFPILQKAAVIFQTGGGVGINYSRLRPEGDVVASSGGVASGPISFMRLVDTVADVIKQGGRRRAANMGVLEVWHPDIMKFIRCKEGGGFENFNISVLTDRDFWDSYHLNRNYPLINPRTGMKVGEVSPRDLLHEIARQAWATGDPGLLFKHHINRRGALHSALGDISAVNPCGEQPLYPYESCNLGSINLYEHVDREAGGIDWEKLRETVEASVRFLDDVITVNRHPFNRLTQENLRHRRVGLGVMGLADMLYALNIPYNSEDGFGTMSKVMEFIAYHAYRASSALAEERGSFPLFQSSVYASGILPIEGFHHPEWWTKDWEGLSGLVRRGVRNSHVTTVAPTGSISMIYDVSAGLEPQFALVYEKHVTVGRFYYVDIELERRLRERGIYSEELLRRIAENGGSLQGIDGIPEDMQDVFVTAREIPWWDHLRAQWEIQKWVDSAVSKTINMPETATVDDVLNAYVTAEKIGVKGITVFRDTSKGVQVLHAKPARTIAYRRNRTLEILGLKEVLREGIIA
jgi:ribonucleoside-diphosphate reductase alpha chain